MSPDQRREIEARLAELPEPDLDDPDNPEWTEDMFARAEGPESLPPEVLAAFPNTARLVREREAAAAKAEVTLRLDRDILERFQADGPDWQARINAALRRALSAA